MKKFYELRDEYDKVHIIISKHGYGKSYYEMKKYLNKLSDENKKKLINRIKTEIAYELSNKDLLKNSEDCYYLIMQIVEKEIWNYEGNL